MIKNLPLLNKNPMMSLAKKEKNSMLDRKIPLMIVAQIFNMKLWSTCITNARNCTIAERKLWWKELKPWGTLNKTFRIYITTSFITLQLSSTCTSTLTFITSSKTHITETSFKPVCLQGPYRTQQEQVGKIGCLINGIIMLQGLKG